MTYDFEEVKGELLRVSTGAEWNVFKNKYPDVKMNEIDEEMRRHINGLFRGLATPEELANPHIHYEVKKKKK